jgi:hypothetical protein
MICEVSFLYSIAYFTYNLNSQNAKICANTISNSITCLFAEKPLEAAGSVLPQQGCSCYYGEDAFVAQLDRARTF